MSVTTQPMTYRFSVEEYHKLGEVGILNEDDRIELLDGELTVMAPIGSPHFATLNDLAALCHRFLVDRSIISQQNPVALDAFSGPEPDLALLRMRDDSYRGGLPKPPDIFLLVEVADSSLFHDRAKLKLYARAGVREVWIVNLSRRCVEVYRQPKGESYASETQVEKGSVAPEALSDVSFALEDFLG